MMPAASMAISSLVAVKAALARSVLRKPEAARPVFLDRRPAAAEVVMEKAVEEILGGGVAGIGPSLRAFLVFPLGGPNLLPARFLPAAVTAVLVAPVTMTADPEHPATVDPPAKPLTRWFLMGPHGGVFGGPEQPRRSMASGILSTEDGRLVSSARHKKLDRGRTVGVLPDRPRTRPTRASALMTAQSLTIGAHRSAVASRPVCALTHDR